MGTEGTFLAPYLGAYLSWLYVDSSWWTVIGLTGTTLFGSRFIVQWLYSEKHGKLIVPPVFWYLSFWGSVITLFYAFHIDKMPVILGNVFLPVVYARNLRLLKKSRQSAADVHPPK